VLQPSRMQNIAGVGPNVISILSWSEHMCDYSLFEYPNRLAAECEELVTYRFSSRSLGLVSAIERNPAGHTQPRKLSLKSICSGFKQMFRDPPPPVAVCVPPGARLVLHNTPAAVRACYGGLAETEEVTFVQTTAAANVHRDAIRFDDGRQFLLHLLPEGLRLRVLRLDSGDVTIPVDSQTDAVVLTGGSF
jgi:hypothetical protein